MSVARLCCLVLGCLLLSACANAQRSQADRDKAISDLEKQIAEFEESPREPSEKVACQYAALGDSYFYCRQFDKAVSAYLRADRLLLLLGKQPVWLIQGVQQIAVNKAAGPITAVELLAKQPMDDPKMAQTIVKGMQDLVVFISTYCRELGPDGLTRVIDRAEELLEPIAFSRDRSLADAAEYRIASIRLVALQSRIREGEMSRDEAQQVRQQAIGDFISKHEGSSVLYFAHYDLGEMLMAKDPLGGASHFRAVIADPNAPESMKVQAKVLMSKGLLKARMADEAEPILKELIAMKPDETDWAGHLTVIEATVGLGKVERIRGNAAQASALFKQALERMPGGAYGLRAEVEELIALGEADLGLRILPEHRRVYEVEAGRMQVSSGASCRASDSVALRVEPRGGDGREISFDISFTSPTPMHPSDAASYIKSEESTDASGCRIKYTGVAQNSWRDGRQWAGYAGFEVATDGPALFASFPEKDISMSAVSTLEADGVFKIVVTVNAPAGVSLRADDMQPHKIISAKGPAGCGYGPQDAHFDPVAKAGEVKYTLNVKAGDGSKLFLPRLVLKVPRAVTPAADGAKPSAEQTKEVSGSIGDTAYRLSTNEAFLPDEQPTGEAIILIIPSIRH